MPEGTRALDELEDWLRGRPVRRLGAATDADEELRNELIRVRRPKDDVELERMRVAEEATRAGFEELVRLIEPGVTERELQIAIEATFLRSGGDSLAYESIVAAGDHSAVLHFSPTSRELKAGELLLVDAGAEYRGYASDVTRTYPIGGELEGEQRVVWETVRRACEAAIEACRPGVEWREVHSIAALIVGRGPGRAGRAARRARDAARERSDHPLLPARRGPHGRTGSTRRRRWRPTNCASRHPGSHASAWTSPSSPATCGQSSQGSTS